MLVEALLLLAPVSALVGYRVGRLRDARRAPPEPRCTGYRARLLDDRGELRDDGAYVSRNDCQALRSPTCIDGRCSFHCRESCRCDASNAPEFTGRSRA